VEEELTLNEAYLKTINTLTEKLNDVTALVGETEMSVITMAMLTVGHCLEKNYKWHSKMLREQGFIKEEMK